MFDFIKNANIPKRNPDESFVHTESGQNCGRSCR